MTEPDSFPDVRKLLHEDAAPPAQAVGTTLGKYRLIREIARGGMAIVYEAEDPDLGRKVAIKVLRDVAVREVDRLRREAMLAARLAHPNIIAIHEVGVVTAGREDSPVHFIAMDFVEGGTLESRLRTAPRDEKLRLLETVAAAVGFAHANGVTHRDLKPANILIAKDGHPVVSDFGLARSSMDPSRLTATGSVLGTPHYMSPEQVSSDLRTIGPASDVWALGVILYEILTGTPPFDGRTAPDLFLRILAREPASPRRRFPGISADLETVCLKALEKDPRRRYPTAREMAEDLRRCREGQPISARPPSAVYRAGKWLRRHRLLMAAIAATLLCAIGGGWGLYHWTKDREYRGHRDRARAAFANRDWAQARFESGEAIKIRRDPDLERMTQGCSGRLAALARIQPLRDLIRETRLCFYIKGEDVRKRLDVVEGALADLENVVGDYPELDVAWQVLGTGWYLTGDSDRAESALGRIPSDPWARFNLGKIYLERALGETVLSAESKEARLARGKEWAAKAAPLLDGGDLGEIERHIADAYRAVAERDFGRADRLCDAALEKFGGSRGAEEFWILHGVYARDEEAIQSCTRALEVRPHYPWAFFLRGVWRLKGKEARLATEDFDRALGLNPRFADAYLNRGIARQDLGDFPGAIDDYSEAIRLRPDSLLFRYHRGQAWLRIKNYDPAIADFSEVLRLDPEALDAYHGRALAWGRKGEYDRAEDDFREALRIDPNQLQCNWGRGLMRIDRGDFAGAIEDLTRALSIAPPDWPYRKRVEEQLEAARKSRKLK